MKQNPTVSKGSDGGEKSLGWSDLDLECSLWRPLPSTAHYSADSLVAVLADRCHLADVKFGPQMTTSSMDGEETSLDQLLQYYNSLNSGMF